MRASTHSLLVATESPSLGNFAMGDAARGSTIVPVLVVRKRKPTPRYSCQPTSSFFGKLPLCSFFAINSLVVATSCYMILPTLPQRLGGAI